MFVNINTVKQKGEAYSPRQLCMCARERLIQADAYGSYTYIFLAYISKFRFNSTKEVEQFAQQGLCNLFNFQEKRFKKG